MPLDCTAAPEEPVTGIRLEFSGAILETYQLQGHWVFSFNGITKDRITGKDGSLSGALLVSINLLRDYFHCPLTRIIIIVGIVIPQKSLKILRNHS